MRNLLVLLGLMVVCSGIARGSQEDQGRLDLAISSRNAEQVKALLASADPGSQASMIKHTVQQDGGFTKSMRELTSRLNMSCNCSGQACGDPNMVRTGLFLEQKLEIAATFKTTALNICQSGKSDGCSLLERIKEIVAEVDQAKAASDQCIAKAGEAEKRRDLAAKENLEKTYEALEKTQAEGDPMTAQLNTPEGIKGEACVHWNRIRLAGQMLSDEKKVTVESGVVSLRKNYHAAKAKQDSQSELAALKKRYREKTGKSLGLKTCPK